jgi:hypothetical protein
MQIQCTQVPTNCLSRILTSPPISAQCCCGNPWLLCTPIKRRCPACSQGMSPFYMSPPFPMWPALSKTCSAPWAGRYWTILYRGFTRYLVPCLFYPLKNALKFFDSGQTKMSACGGAMVPAAVCGVLCGRDPFADAACLSFSGVF